MRFDPRVLRTVLIWAVILVATLLSGLAAVLETGVLTPRLIAWANRHLEEEGGLHLEAASVYLRPWSGLTVNDVWLTIPSEHHPAATGAARDTIGVPRAPSFGQAPSNGVFAVDQIEIGYRVTGLLGGSPRIRRVKLVNPDFDLPEFERWLRRRADDPPGPAPEKSRRPRTWGLRIDDLRILEGRLETRGGGLVSGLRLTGRVEKTDGEWRLILDEGGARFVSDRIDERLEVTGAVAYRDGNIRLEGLHLSVAGGRLSFEGNIDPSGVVPSSLRATGYALSLEEVGSWFGAHHPLLQADLEFRLLASGRPDSLALRGGFRGLAEGGVARDFHFAGVRHRDHIELETLRVVAGRSRINVTGSLSFDGEPKLDGVAVFHSLELAEVLANPNFAPVSGLDGVMWLNGRGSTRASLDAQAELRLTGAVLFGMPVDSLELRSRMKDGELQLTSARVRKGETIVTGAGVIDPQDQVVAELEGQIPDLADLLRDHDDSPIEAIGGVARLEARLLGPLVGPGLEATLAFEDATVFGARAQGLEASVVADRLGSGSELRLDVRGRRIEYEGREIPVARAIGSLREGELTVTRLECESDRRGSLVASGALTFGRGSVAGEIDLLEVTPPDGSDGWRNRDPIRVERRAGVLSVKGLELRNGSGHVTADVQIDRTGETTVSASGERVDLSLFSPFLLTPRPLAGTLAFRTDGILGADTLAVDARIDLTDGRWGENALEEIRGGVSLRDDRLRFDEMVFRSSAAKADLSGELVLPSGSFRELLADSTTRAAALDRIECRGLRARMESPDWSWFWDRTPWPDLGGAGTLLLDVEGSATRPKAEIWGRLVSGELGPEPIEEAVATGSSADGRVTIRDAWLRTGPGRLRASGTLPVTWSLVQPKPALARADSFDLKLDARDFPVAGLSAFIPLFEMAQGSVMAEASLAGMPGSAFFLGDFSVENVIVTLPTFADPLVNGTVAGRFVPAGVEIVAARLEDGRRGKVEANGRVDLANLVATDWDIEVRADGYHYEGEVNGIRGVGKGHVSIEAVPQPNGRLIPLVAGAFDVVSGSMDERVLSPVPAGSGRLEIPAGINAPPFSPEAAAPTDGPAVPGMLFVEIDFRADNNLWLRTPEIQVEMAGDVTLFANPAYVGLVGQLRTVQGKYSVLNTVFNVDRAEVRFYDASDPAASTIDAEATTNVLDEEVTASVSGALLDPVIRLSTDSGMTEREIYELLALRQKRVDPGAEDTGTGVVTSQLVASWGVVLASRFGQELGQEMGLDTFEVEQGQKTTRIGVGKSLSSNLFLRVRQEVANSENDPLPETSRERLETPERQILLEYRLNRIFQLQGEAGTIREPEPTNYLNIDLKAEWGY